MLLAYVGVGAAPLGLDGAHALVLYVDGVRVARRPLDVVGERAAQVARVGKHDPPQRRAQLLDIITAVRGTCGLIIVVAARLVDALPHPHDARVPLKHVLARVNVARGLNNVFNHVGDIVVVVVVGVGVELGLGLFGRRIAVVAVAAIASLGVVVVIIIIHILQRVVFVVFVIVERPQLVVVDGVALLHPLLLLLNLFISSAVVIITHRALPVMSFHIVSILSQSLL